MYARMYCELRHTGLNKPEVVDLPNETKSTVYALSFKVETQILGAFEKKDLM